MGMNKNCAPYTIMPIVNCVQVERSLECQPRGAGVAGK